MPNTSNSHSGMLRPGSNICLFPVDRPGDFFCQSYPAASKLFFFFFFFRNRPLLGFSMSSQ